MHHYGALLWCVSLGERIGWPSTLASVYTIALISDQTPEVNVFDAKQLDELTRGVLNALPSGVREVQQDLGKNLRAALQSVFTKLDLVTREEFEVQSAVLLRTREKLTALEARVAELEKLSGKE